MGRHANAYEARAAEETAGAVKVTDCRMRALTTAAVMLAGVIMVACALSVGSPQAYAAQLTTGSVVAQQSSSQTVYRLYNPRSGEHLFTLDTNEYKVLPRYGWKQEGAAWQAPAAGSPVYRLYNPYSGDHHYTADTNEYKVLPRYGWKQEGVAWRSAGTNGIPVYRLYNPYAAIGSHHFTIDTNEYKVLPRYGWKQEGIGWYAARPASSAAASGSSTQKSNTAASSSSSSSSKSSGSLSQSGNSSSSGNSTTVGKSRDAFFLNSFNPDGSVSDVQLFDSQNDLMLYWQSEGYDVRHSCGITYLVNDDVDKYHVHDYDAVEYSLTIHHVKCECGRSFSAGCGPSYGGYFRAGEYYSAEDNWAYHRLCTGFADGHGSYVDDDEECQNVYVASHACSCGSKPVDSIYKKNLDISKHVRHIVKTRRV